MKRIIIGGIVILIAGALLLTVVALLFETNPPVVSEPLWDSQQTRALAVRACFDCHSNETRWPWFTKLPFGSWLAVTDTIRGRNSLNFSEWGVLRSGEGEGEGRNSREIARVIERGSMPPGTYTLLHPEAVLTDAEKQQLIAGLQNSLK
jgi:hypothetical protein